MNAQTPIAMFARWSPRDGETVHLRAPNRWDLPAGRYRLRWDRAWTLHGVSGSGLARASAAQLVGAEASTILTAISEADLERERQEVQLRTAAPLRQRRDRDYRPQHDASDLALFRAVNEPGLF